MVKSFEIPNTERPFESGPGDIVIDIDYDFFFDCEETVVDAPWKKLSMAPPPTELINSFNHFEFLHIVAHDEALEACIEKGIQN